MKDLLQRVQRAQQAGNLAEAARLCGEILRADPKNFQALLSMAFVHFAAARFAEAERFSAEAARVGPQSADAAFLRGCALHRLGRYADALASFERAVVLRPTFVEALINRGGSLMAEKRYEEALGSFDAALAINPNLTDAWNNRANALCELGRHSEAVTTYDKVLAIRPNAVETWINRGTALIALRRFDDALASYDEAARLDPQRTDALAGRANALFESKAYEAAASAYAAVLARDPNYPYATGNLAFSRLYCCDWSTLPADRLAVARGIREGRPVANPFQAIALIDSPADLKRCAQSWSAGKFPPRPPLSRSQRYGHDKIRVAYLSADFNGHAVATLLAGVWEQQDKSRFETTAISYVEGDSGSARRRLARAFDSVVDVAGKSDADVAALLRRLEIDIVVDLMGYTGECRPGIFAFRPAPIAVNFLGFPGTMGAPYIDYLIADRHVIPEERRGDYSETVIYLPDTYLPADDTRAIAERPPSRIEAGLPEKGFVFCSFNNSYKFTPEMFSIWMRLLQAVDESVLWLPHANDAAIRNLRREAEARGTAASRLVFAPFAHSAPEHLARLRLADLFLDTLPYNAHSTASDALWAGVPVVTTPGESFAARVASSLLRALGLDDLILDSLPAYERLALRLALDPAALSSVRARLARSRTTHAAFDTARFTRNVEAAYVEMYEAKRPS